MGSFGMDTIRAFQMGLQEKMAQRQAEQEAEERRLRLNELKNQMARLKQEQATQDFKTRYGIMQGQPGPSVPGVEGSQGGMEELLNAQKGAPQVYRAPIGGLEEQNFPHLPVPIPEHLGGGMITPQTQQQVQQKTLQDLIAKRKVEAMLPTNQDTTPFASSTGGIFDTRTGQITAPFEKPPTPDKSITPFEVWAQQNPGKRVEDYLKFEAGLSNSNRGPSGLTPAAEANIINRLSTQWSKATQEIGDLKRQAQLMELGLSEARRGNTAAGAQAVLVTFQKILDPTSVVRESEYARSGSGQSLLNQMQGAMERLVQGGAGIPVEQLEGFANLARLAVQQAGSSSNLNSIKVRIGKTADRYQIPRDLVVTDVAEEPGAQAAGGPGAAPAKKRYVEGVDF